MHDPNPPQHPQEVRAVPFLARTDQRRDLTATPVGDQVNLGAEPTPRAAQRLSPLHRFVIYAIPLPGSRRATCGGLRRHDGGRAPVESALTVQWHTFATLAEEAGVRVKKIQEALDHANSSTTDIYLTAAARLEGDPSDLVAAAIE